MARGDSIFAPDQDPAQPEKRPLAGTLLWTMTVASAAAVANIYYNQPLLAEMMRAFHASPHAIGLVATFTQVGYALGLPVFVPFGDFVERRRLVVLLFLAEGCSLIAAALAQNKSRAAVTRLEACEPSCAAALPRHRDCVQSFPRR
jgi:predicted MFS family arabinose efflux permease